MDEFSGLNELENGWRTQVSEKVGRRVVDDFFLVGTNLKCLAGTLKYCRATLIVYFSILSSRVRASLSTHAARLVCALACGPKKLCCLLSALNALNA